MPLASTSTDGRPRRFIVATTGTQIILEEVMLVSCQDIVTLNARIVDKSDQPHTFHWQQISGTPVQWLEDQNQLMVMWRQPTGVERDDKIFRFWLDRGTVFEKHQDILVTGVNREPIRLPVAGTNSVTQNWQDGQVIAPSTMQAMPAPRIDNPDGVVVNAELRAISFVTPANQQFIQSFRLIKLEDGTEAEVAVLSVEGENVRRYVTDIRQDVAYRIATVTNTYGLEKTLSAPERRFARSPGTHELDTFEDAALKPRVGVVDVSQTVIQREMGEIDIVSDTSNITASVTPITVFTADVITRELADPVTATSTSDIRVGVTSLHFTKTVNESSGVVIVG